MRFDRLDLNLLVALDALLKEGNVSGAARRLNLSQSAMSGTLARLREYFDDALLVTVGRGMVATTRALELQEPVAKALLLIRSTIMTPVEFDPATAERMFTIVASDYVYDVLLAETLRSVATDAPHIGFEIIAPNTTAQERFETGEIDLVITLDSYTVGDHPSTTLFSDDLAVICWDQNPHCRDGVSLETFLAMGHVVPLFGPNRTLPYSEKILDEVGLSRRISCGVPYFGSMPQTIIGTDRLGTMNRRHAEYFARTLPLKVFPVPFKTQPLVEVMQQHRVREKDLGVRWLADLIVQSVRSAGL